MVPVGRQIPDSIVQGNIDALARQLRDASLDALLLFDPANMLAFTGTPHAAWDRLTCAAVTHDGQVLLVCPAFERPSVLGAERHARIVTCQETDDPYQVFADALRELAPGLQRLGCDGRIWLDAFERFRAAMPGVTFENAESVVRTVRIQKSADELNRLRAAQQAGQQLFFAIRDLLEPGVREIDVHRALVEQFAPRGLTVNPMIQSGPNGAVPHNPTGERVLQDGDLVVVDSVVNVDGYFSDITRTFALGAPSETAQRVYGIVRAAQAAAIEAARPGATCRELDHIARRIITDAGYGPHFLHRLGHGIGIECHEPPYLNAGNDEPLVSGACVTIEPGIYLPAQFGVRIEDVVIITETGCEVLRSDLATDVSDALADQ